MNDKTSNIIPFENPRKILELQKVVGLQKSILFLIFEECWENRAYTTRPLPLKYISELVKHNKNSVKGAIKCLKKKGLIERTDFKNGRGGWTQYFLPS